MDVLSVSRSWGATAEERARSYPCDGHLPGADGAYFRAVTVAAPAPVLFRWLCQLRVAPYSYDWIDNGGRESPRTLTPGVERPAVGDPVMSIFELIAFEPDRHLTMRLRDGATESERNARLVAGARRMFPEIVLTYLVAPATGRTVRLIMKFLARYPPGVVGWLQRTLLPWGDLVMARRQLLNLRDLAERSAAARARAGGESRAPG